MRDKAEILMLMARNQFGRLTEAEEKLFRAAAEGDVAEFRVGTGALNHPGFVKDWGEDRWLRADRIAWLCAKAFKVSSRCPFCGDFARAMRIACQEISCLLPSPPRYYAR